MPPPHSPLPGTPDARTAACSVTDRALSCRSVLWTRAEAGERDSAGLLELDVRRCPVGPVLAVDCPEWAGLPCRAFEARGEAPPTVLGRDEAEALRADLAAEGTLTERYRRRLRPLTAAPTGRVGT